MERGQHPFRWWGRIRDNQDASKALGNPGIGCIQAPPDRPDIEVQERPDVRQSFGQTRPMLGSDCAGGQEDQPQVRRQRLSVVDQTGDERPASLVTRSILLQRQGLGNQYSGGFVPVGLFERRACFAMRAIPEPIVQPAST